MKLNNPATWFLVASVAAVGLMAAANASSTNCSRLSLQKAAQTADGLDGDAAAEAEVTRIMGVAHSAATAAGLYWDYVISRAFPRCPKPLPADATFFDTETGVEISAGEARANFVETMEPIMELLMYGVGDAQAGAAAPRVTRRSIHRRASRALKRSTR